MTVDITKGDLRLSFEWFEGEQYGTWRIWHSGRPASGLRKDRVTEIKRKICDRIGIRAAVLKGGE